MKIQQIARQAGMKLSLRMLLALFLVVSLMPGLIMASATLNAYYSTQTNDALAAHAEQTRAIAESTDEALLAVRDALYKFANKKLVEEYIEGTDAYKVRNYEMLQDALDDMIRYVFELDNTYIVTPQGLVTRDTIGHEFTQSKYLELKRLADAIAASDSNQTRYGYFVDDAEPASIRRYVSVCVRAPKGGAIVAFARADKLLGQPGLNAYKYAVTHAGQVILTNAPDALAGVKDNAGIAEYAGQRLSVTGFTNERLDWTVTIVRPLAGFASVLSGFRLPLTLIVLFLLGEIALVLGVYLCVITPIKDISRRTLAACNDNSEIINPAMSRSELRLLVSSINGMKEATAKLSADIAEERLNRMQSNVDRLRAINLFLQAQINPHLLYNMLECICGMAVADNSPRIRLAALALADMYRYCIKSADATLEEELESVERFALLMQYRREKPFTLICDVDDAYQSLRMPRMILEPIVENAVQHGFVSGVDAVNTVKISAYYETERLYIVVDDNGCGITEERRAELNRLLAGGEAQGEDDMHIGIVSVHSRLKYRFGDDCGVSIEKKLSQGARVKLTLRLS